MALISPELEREAWLMLEDRGAVFDVARLVTECLDRAKTVGGIIGGVAVNLHGRHRATADVDVYIADSLADFAAELQASGFDFDAEKREFTHSHVPVHLVNSTQAQPNPKSFQLVQDVRVVSLADLINLKLRTGLTNPRRARDLGDVTDLIQANGLDSRFAGRIEKSMRDDFRRIVKSLRAAPPPPATGDPYSHLG